MIQQQCSVIVHLIYSARLFSVQTQSQSNYALLCPSWEVTLLSATSHYPLSNPRNAMMIMGLMAMMLMMMVMMMTMMISNQISCQNCCDAFLINLNLYASSCLSAKVTKILVSLRRHHVLRDVSKAFVFVQILSGASKRLKAVCFHKGRRSTFDTLLQEMMAELFTYTTIHASYLYVRRKETFDYTTK